MEYPYYLATKIHILGINEFHSTREVPLRYLFTFYLEKKSNSSSRKKILFRFEFVFLDQIN